MDNNPVMLKFFILFLTGFLAVASAETKTNVIFILADDLGWSDTTLYGKTKFYKTPNLERLAKRGMTFTRAYADSPVCSPTRASFLTGQSPARLGLTLPLGQFPEVVLNAAIRSKAPISAKAISCISATRLDTSHFTLAKALKANGYATGHFGKWHLGSAPYGSDEQGFDVSLPGWSGDGPAGSYIEPWKFPPVLKFYPRSPEEHIEDRMADEAVMWMEKNKDRPFFLNYWQFSVHGPFNAKEPLVAKYRKSIDLADAQRSPTYAAMVESMDDAVGKILDAVDRLGIADQTAIIFYSDNGGNMFNAVDDTIPTSNRPLRGGKATVYEGGVRVPCVISWPELTAPDSRNDTMIQTSDFYPTFLDLLGINPQKDQIFDGTSIASALRGKPLKRKAIFSYFPHSPNVPDTLPPSATVTTDDWKLIRLFHQGENGKHSYLLYHLKEDIGESMELSEQHPERVKEMDAMIENFLVRTKAITPKPNPKYDPKAPVLPKTDKKNVGRFRFEKDEVVE